MLIQGIGWLAAFAVHGILLVTAAALLLSSAKRFRSVLHRAPPRSGTSTAEDRAANAQIT